MLRFITVEGGDGSGKTTHLSLLRDYLSSKGLSCLMTREPGDTALGRGLRQLLVQSSTPALSPETELFLILADRAEHVRSVIRPGFERQQLVLCDRFTDSTIAYQGYGRGLDLDLLHRMNRFATGGVAPDLTFLFDCAVDIALKRASERMAAGGAQREDRFERESMDFHKRVREGFLKVAQAEPSRVIVINTEDSRESVHRRMREIVDRKLFG